MTLDKFNQGTNQIFQSLSPYIHILFDFILTEFQNASWSRLISLSIYLIGQIIITRAYKHGKHSIIRLIVFIVTCAFLNLINIFL